MDTGDIGGSLPVSGAMAIQSNDNESSRGSPIRK